MNINTLLKDGLDSRGGKHYGFLIPTIAELLKDKIEKKTKALEDEVKGLITDALIKRAVSRHTATQKNQQTQKETTSHENQ
jgi:hypothetical protein